MDDFKILRLSEMRTTCFDDTNNFYINVFVKCKNTCSNLVKDCLYYAAQIVVARTTIYSEEEYLIKLLIFIYFKEFNQRVARQQHSKHGPIRNNRGSCVFCRLAG
jgi:hypothetical protein